MVSNPNISLAHRVSLTLSTPALALSFTATALPAAPALSPDVFMDSSCVFSQLFPSNVTRTCCSCACPQGWEHGQVISRADRQCLLSSAVYGDRGFTTRAGREHCQGIFKAITWFDPYFGGIHVCVAESTSCSLEIWVWFLGMANMCVLFAGGKFSYSGPGGRALGQGRHCPNKVTCVTLSPELAVTPIESSMLSSNSWAVYTTVSILHKPWNGLQPLEQSISYWLGFQTTCMCMDCVQIHSEDLLMQSNSCTG